MKTLLITGVNGFLGSHLAESLKESYHIIGLTSEKNSRDRVRHLPIEFVSSGESLDSVFSNHKVYAVIHTATIYRKQDGSISSMLKVNISLPVTLMELCLKYDVDLFLNTDSFFNSNYSYSYLSEYTLTKKQSLEWLKLLVLGKGSLKLVNMKLFHIYGENDSRTKFIPNLISLMADNISEVKMTEGKQKRDFIYVKDVVSAYETVLSSTETLDMYQEFQVGTGLSVSIKEFALLLKRLLTSETKLLFGAIPMRQGEIEDSRADNSSLVKLGWIPKFSLEQGLSQFVLDE